MFVDKYEKHTTTNILKLNTNHKRHCPPCYLFLALIPNGRKLTSVIQVNALQTKNAHRKKEIIMKDIRQCKDYYMSARSSRCANRCNKIEAFIHVYPCAGIGDGQSKHGVGLFMSHVQL